MSAVRRRMRSNLKNKAYYTCSVVLLQIMLPCSRAGLLYAIDTDAVNAGIPYADSFSLTVHWCLRKVSETQSSIEVYGQIKFKKSVWGLVKGIAYRLCHICPNCVKQKFPYRHDREELLPGPGRLLRLPRQGIEIGR